MRKSLFFAGLAAAALTLVGCNKEADFAGKGRKVEIVLSDVATRTINSGMSTEWNAGDELSVFNAEAGTTTWSSNIKFTVQDASANRATGEVELTADAYDWYAFYPYTAQIPNPTTVDDSGAKKGYTTVGGQTQVQKTDDNKDHLAGTKVPIFGHVKNVPADEMPVIEMKNAASVACFKVTNALEEAIRILSVKFTAPEDIVGTYYIDFSGDAPTFVGSGENYVKDNVTVTNSDPSSIAPDSNGEFYAVIKPFTAEAGAKLKVEIEAESADGAKKATATKEITLSAATEFKSGFIKMLNIPFDVALEETAPEGLPYSEAFKGVGIGKFSIDNVNLPSQLTFVWTYDSKYGMKASAFVNGTAYQAESWLVSPLIDLTSATLPQLSFKHAVNQFTSIAKAKEEATVWARVKGGSWTQLEVNYPADLGWTFVESGAIDLSDFAGELVQIGFKYTSTADKAGTWEIQDFLVQDASVPEFGVEQTSFEVAANVTSVTVHVTGNVAWTVQDVSEGVTPAPTSGSGAGTIAVSFPANTDPIEKAYSLKVITDNAALVDAGEEEFVIDITQAAASTEAKSFPYEESFATSQGDFTINDVNKPTDLNYVWAFDSRGFMKASAFKSNTNYDAESWLISPVVDLATAQNPELTFAHATNYFSSPAKAQEETSVWVREEGGAWAAVEGVNYPTSQGWTFVDSGSLDLSAYKGKKIQIGFKYTSTATKSGTWEIQNFKLDEGETGPVNQNFTWDLSTASYSSATENQVVWTHDAATMTATKAGASTPANNYLGGDSNNRTSSRFYANSNLAFAPASGITIIKVEYTATSTSYASAMANSTWTNASAVASGTKVEITPADGTQAFSAVLGATSGGTAMKVYYSGEAAPAATLTGIAVSGQKTEFTVGDAFTHDTAVVTATYNDNSTKNVTASATFSEPDMSTAGTKEVTVSYTEGGVSKSTSYNITVSEAATGVKTLSMTMNDYVAAHGCTVSANNVATMYKSLRLNDSVKMSTTGEDNCGSFWGATTVDWRLYQAKGGDVTISVADGCELKSVKFTYGVSNGGTLLDASSNQVSSGTTVTASGSSVTFTVGNTGEATNGQVKITAVEVKYTGEGTFPVDPDVPMVITTVINMPGNQTVYVGETIELNATSNVEGATITYESEDPTIASVSAAGVVTGVAEGTVKVYARIAGVAGSYTDAERYCNVTVSNKPDVVGGTWEATALSSIADGAEFILVSTKGDASYAMSNDNGTGSAPAAVSVTVSGNTLSNPASNLVFVLKKVEGGYVFGIKDKETTLYCFNNNNGLRVGTNAHNVFSLDSEC